MTQETVGADSGRDLLLHTCCGPCTTYCKVALEALGWTPHGLFYNPNVHPFKEFERRAETMRAYADRVGMDLEVVDEYGLREFLNKVGYERPAPERCRACYEMRLRRAARAGKARGCGGFTTTLLVSPYQAHDVLKAVGEEVGSQEGIPFIYVDMRPGYRQSRQMARDMGLYMQPYCGCILSEEERYRRDAGRCKV